jgi:hypothetical protein
MILSEDRQIRLAHVITDQIWDDDLVEYSDESQAIKLAKKAVLEFMAEEEELDKKATEKVNSLKRGVVQGSPEWDILYRKYYEEERGKRGKG